jgi:hypothetical protein
MDSHSLALMAAFFTQLKWNSVGAFIIDRAQKSKLPFLSWISTNTPWVTRIVSFIFATGAAVGVHWTYNPKIAGGQLLITGLGLSAIVTAIGQIAQNYAMQHGWGKLFGMDMNVLKAAIGFPGAPVPAAFSGTGLSPQPQTGGATKP